MAAKTTPATMSGRPRPVGKFEPSWPPEATAPTMGFDGRRPPRLPGLSMLPSRRHLARLSLNDKEVPGHERKTQRGVARFVR